MLVYIRPIIKVLKDKSIFVVLEEDGKSLPEVILREDLLRQPIDQVGDFILDEYGIKPEWVELYYVDLFLDKNCDLILYYSTFAPMDFLNEETTKKVTSDLSKLPREDCVKIGQALSLSPY